MQKEELILEGNKVMLKLQSSPIQVEREVVTGSWPGGATLEAAWRLLAKLEIQLPFDPATAL